MKKSSIITERTKRLSWLALVVLAVIFSFQTVKGNSNLQDETRTVSGTVVDAETGEPLPGVSIVIKGTSSGAITDIDGKYNLDASSNDILVFSYVGFLSEEITVGDRTLIDLTMAMDIMGMDEVVVIGYGVQKKKLVTGATTQVKSDDIENNHGMRLESSLQGLTPGMVIVKQSGQPGSDYNISIRGLSSPNGNQPLILIDGVPGDFSAINPNDIESVDVLKDAASAAIYGSRGGNGVILVTTKKGREGKSMVSYDFSYGVSNPTNKVEMLNAKQYAEIMNEASLNTFPTRDVPFSDEYIAGLGEGTDWQEEAYNKNAPQVNHYLNFAGGTEKSTYSISLSYNSEEGIFDYDGKSFFERYGIRVNSEHKVKDYLKVGQNISYTHRNSNAMGTGNQYNNFIRGLLEASPLLPVYDPNSPDGFARSGNNEEVEGAPVPTDEQINPIASMHYNYNDKNKNDDLVGNIYIELEPIKGLRIRTDFGAKVNYFTQTNATDSFTLTPYTYNSDPYYRQKAENNYGYNWDNFITYDRDFGDHNFLAMVGLNVQDNWYYYVEGRADGYLVNQAPILSNVATIVRDSVQGDFGFSDSRRSVFGRLSYNYQEKYMATFSLRRDGSSRFGKNNRFGVFPAVSLGWVMSSESFMDDISWLNFMKLRASWGQNGTEPTRAGAFLATVGNENRYYYFDNQYVGVSPDRFPNPDLRWEAQEQLNFGFDSRFLKDFNFTFDWYEKKAKDWIIPVQVAGVSGIAGINEYEDPLVNAGDLVNRGVEFDLGYNKKFGDFFLGVRANLAYNKNEVLNVPGEVINGSSSVLFNGSAEFYRVEEGFPMGFFWGYKTDGIFQTVQEIEEHANSEGRLLQPNAVPGDVRRLDLNDDGRLNADDKTMIGDPNPDYVLGFTLNTNYKGFDFSMNLQGQLGNQVVQVYRQMERAFPNYSTAVLDRWQWIDGNNNGEIDPGEGTSNTYPRVTFGSERNQNWREISDLLVHDADYVRVKSINIGYDLSKLFQNSPIEKFRVHMTFLNLLTFTKYNGMDPEVGYGSYYDEQGLLRDAYASGIDMGFYPSALTIMGGVNVKF